LINPNKYTPADLRTLASAAIKSHEFSQITSNLALIYAAGDVVRMPVMRYYCGELKQYNCPPKETDMNSLADGVRVSLGVYR